MVRQATSRVETGNMEESTRYMNYLRTLADLAAMAGIVAVQVKQLDPICKMSFIRIVDFDSQKRTKVKYCT